MPLLNLRKRLKKHLSKFLENKFKQFLKDSPEKFLLFPTNIYGIKRYVFHASLFRIGMHREVHVFSIPDVSFHNNIYLNEYLQQSYTFLHEQPINHLSLMKIMHIAECAGGVERYLSMLLPLLEQRNIKQFFICSQNYDKKKYENIVDGVKQIDLKQSFSPLYAIRKILELRKEIKSVHPDIVYCHSSFAGGLGRLAAWGLSCKIVYNPHGWAFNMI